MEHEPSAREIESIRLSSRQMVRELGMLTSTHCALGITSSECHAMIELEQSGPLSVVELATRLNLDRSTVSRLADGLVRRGFVASVDDKDDSRKKALTLSRKGRMKLGEVHAQANFRVRTALTQVAAPEREAIVRGIELYAGALHRARELSDLELRPIKKSDNATIRKIVLDSLSEFGANRPGFAALDEELHDLYSSYSRDRHSYFVVTLAGELVGGAGVAPLQGGEEHTCELRKMYLTPKTRGKGIGKLLLQRCLDEARALGFTICYLETLSAMRAAQHLYTTFGFKKLTKPLGCTGHFGCDCWMEREL